MTKEMYKLSQKLLSNTPITDLIDRWGTVIANSNDRTQFNIGQKVKITGKEGGSTFRVITKKGKTGYVEMCDFELVPITIDEFKIAKADLEEEVKLLNDKIAYFEETKATEFNEINFSAWTVARALRDKSDENEIIKIITEALQRNSTVTS